MTRASEYDADTGQIHSASLAGVTTTNSAVASSLGSVVEEVYNALSTPPPSVVQAIMTGIPSSIIAGYEANPAAVLTELGGTKVPDWASSLPTDVVGYLSSQAAVVNSVFTKHGLTHTSAFMEAISSAVSELSSDLEAVPTGVSESSDDEETTATSDLVLVTGASSADNSTLVTSSRSGRTSTTKETSTATTTRSTGASASTSPARVTSNPAARPTGALAASLAGLVGVLGVAVAL